MILVTGASGNLGKGIIEQLLTKIPANGIAAMVREESKATDLKAKGVNIRVATYDNPTSLEKAFEGISHVVLVSSSVLEGRLQQHINVIDAAKKVGVKHISYTSIPISNWDSTALKPLSDSHVGTENYLKNSGLTYTIFQNTLYAETILLFAGANALKSGIYFPAGNGLVAFATRADMAEGIANAIAQGGNENKSYAITGAQAHSFGDIAAILSELSGNAVTYTSPEPNDFEQLLTQFNVPAEGILVSLLFAATIKNHDLEIVSSDLENFLGRKPMELKEFLKAAYL